MREVYALFEIMALLKGLKIRFKSGKSLKVAFLLGARLIKKVIDIDFVADNGANQYIKCEM